MARALGRRSVWRGAARRLDDRLLLVLILSICLLVFYALRYWSMPSFAPITGIARVIDGDSIEMSGIRLRLEGIDAPEWDQTCRDGKGRPWWCGRTASQELAGLVRGRELTCKPEGFDRYRRVLAVCRLADGSDLNARLVRQGWAVVSGYASGYQSEQAEAKAARRGIWIGDFDLPREWRRRHSDLLGR